MTKETIKATVRREVKQLLIQKKVNTGRSVSELVEFAVVNMPFIPNKGKGKNLIRKR